MTQRAVAGDLYPAEIWFSRTSVFGRFNGVFHLELLAWFLYPDAPFHHLTGPPKNPDTRIRCLAPKSGRLQTSRFVLLPLWRTTIQGGHLGPDGVSQRPVHRVERLGVKRRRTNRRYERVDAETFRRSTGPRVSVRRCRTWPVRT